MKPLLLSALVAFAALPAAADVVVRRDGGRIEGAVLAVDAEFVTVKTDRGTTRVARKDVASIDFEAQAVPPPLKIEIRNVASDDSLDVLLDGEPVIRDASEGGEWVDLTPRLKDGNNDLRLRIRNERGTWAYRFHVRINGTVTPISCGTARRREDPCRCCGKTGVETGVIDDLPPVWIHVDRALGRAEVMP